MKRTMEQIKRNVIKRVGRGNAVRVRSAEGVAVSRESARAAAELLKAQASMT